MGGEKPFFQPDWCPGPSTLLAFITSSVFLFARNDGVSHKCAQMPGPQVLRSLCKVFADREEPEPARFA